MQHSIYDINCMSDVDVTTWLTLNEIPSLIGTWALFQLLPCSPASRQSSLKLEDEVATSTFRFPMFTPNKWYWKERQLNVWRIYGLLMVETLPLVLG